MKRIWVTAAILWIGMFCIGCEGEKNPPQTQPSLSPTPLPAASVPAKDPNQSVALDADPALVGWWKFDEVSGSTAADSSSKNHGGIIEGGLSFNTQSAPGRIGIAVKLDGKDGFIRIPDYKGITGTRPRTIAVWIKTTRPEGQIISWGHDDFGRMWIMEFIRGRIGVTPNGGYYYMKAATDDDAWHHVAVVIQSASPPNLHDHAKLFKDGELAEVDDIGLLDLWPIDTGDSLDVCIGRGYQGLIDDLRIYNRALSDHEIGALFRLQSDRPLSQP
jgi:uncharacterized protein